MTELANHPPRLSTAKVSVLRRLQSLRALAGAVLVLALWALCYPFYESTPDDWHPVSELAQRDWLIGTTTQQFWASPHLYRNVDVRIAVGPTLLWLAGSSVLLAILWSKHAGVGVLGRCSYRSALQLVIVGAILWDTWGFSASQEAAIFGFIPLAALIIHHGDRVPLLRVLPFVVVNGCLLPVCMVAYWRSWSDAPATLEQIVGILQVCLLFASFQVAMVLFMIGLTWVMNRLVRRIHRGLLKKMSTTFSSRLTSDDLRTIDDLLACREPAATFAVLVERLLERDARLSPAEYAKLNTLGVELHLEPERWRGLQPQAAAPQ